MELIYRCRDCGSLISHIVEDKTIEKWGCYDYIKDMRLFDNCKCCPKTADGKVIYVAADLIKVIK